MSRHDDTRSAGRSRLVPFIANEAPQDRHRRRLDANLEQGATPLYAWCAKNGITLAIKNAGCNPFTSAITPLRFLFASRNF